MSPVWPAARAGRRSPPAPCLLLPLTGAIAWGPGWGTDRPTGVGPSMRNSNVDVGPRIARQTSSIAVRKFAQSESRTSGVRRCDDADMAVPLDQRPGPGGVSTEVRTGSLRPSAASPAPCMARHECPSISSLSIPPPRRRPRRGRPAQHEADRARCFEPSGGVCGWWRRADVVLSLSIPGKTATPGGVGPLTGRPRRACNRVTPPPDFSDASTACNSPSPSGGHNRIFCERGAPESAKNSI